MLDQINTSVVDRTLVEGTASEAITPGDSPAAKQRLGLRNGGRCVVMPAGPGGLRMVHTEDRLPASAGVPTDDHHHP